VRGLFFFLTKVVLKKKKKKRPTPTVKTPFGGFFLKGLKFFVWPLY